jgi:hypothetical protein
MILITLPGFNSATIVIAHAIGARYSNSLPPLFDVDDVVDDLVRIAVYHELDHSD